MPLIILNDDICVVSKKLFYALERKGGGGGGVRESLYESSINLPSYQSKCGSSQWGVASSFGEYQFYKYT
jgi:hypothetical protein